MTHLMISELIFIGKNVNNVDYLIGILNIKLKKDLWYPWISSWFLNLAQKEYGSEEATTAFKWLQTQIVNTDYLEFVKSKYSELFEKNLTGQPAPYLYLADNRGEYQELSNFK